MQFYSKATVEETYYSKVKGLSPAALLYPPRVSSCEFITEDLRIADSLLNYYFLQSLGFSQFSPRHFVSYFTFSSLPLFYHSELEIRVLFVQVFLLFANIMVPFSSTQKSF